MTTQNYALDQAPETRAIHSQPKGLSPVGSLWALAAAIAAMGSLGVYALYSHQDWGYVLSMMAAAQMLVLGAVAAWAHHRREKTQPAQSGWRSPWAIAATGLLGSAIGIGLAAEYLLLTNATRDDASGLTIVIANKAAAEWEKAPRHLEYVECNKSSKPGEVDRMDRQCFLTALARIETPQVAIYAALTGAHLLHNTPEDHELRSALKSMVHRVVSYSWAWERGFRQRAPLAASFLNAVDRPWERISKRPSDDLGNYLIALQAIDPEFAKVMERAVNERGAATLIFEGDHRTAGVENRQLVLPASKQ